MKNYDLNTMKEFIEHAYHSTIAITGDDMMTGEFAPSSVDVNLTIAGANLTIPNNKETFQLVKHFLENLQEYKDEQDKEYSIDVIDKADGYWYYLKSSKTDKKYYVYYDECLDAAFVYEEEMFDVEAGLYEPNIYVGHYHVGGREEFKIPTKENYKISAYKDIIDLIREYENQNKKYQLYENSYTIEELRIGYRVITGLDNDDEFSDEELYQYMLETMKEEK